MDTTLRPPWWARLGGPRAKWLVIGAWVLAALALGPLQPRLQEATVNDPAVFLPAEAESTQVLELLGERFASGRTTPALVVYRNVNGLSEEDEAAIAEDVEAFASVDGAQGSSRRSPRAPARRACARRTGRSRSPSSRSTPRRSSASSRRSASCARSRATGAPRSSPG